MDIGHSYFPVEIGKWVLYEVDTAWRDDIIGPIGAGELSYVLRDVNESIFIDEGGREAVRVERQRQTGTGSWAMKDVWSRVQLPQFAEQNEENVIFIKHNFPIREGKMWDGHARATPGSIFEIYGEENIPSSWDFTYQDVDRPYSIGSLTFDSTVTVLQIDRPVPAGTSIYSVEVYAKHVGLIYKKLTLYRTQSVGAADTVGYEFEMRAIDFGP